MRGEGGRSRESLDSLRTSSGVCGERLGVDEAQLGDREMLRLKGGRRASAGAAKESLSNDTFRPILFLPSIMWEITMLRTRLQAHSKKRNKQGGGSDPGLGCVVLCWNELARQMVGSRG